MNGAKFLFILIVFFMFPLGSIAQSDQITQIEVQGNVQADKELILTTFGLSSGDVLSTDKVQAGVKRLYSLGIFSDINVSVAREAKGIKLTISVEEFPVLEKLNFKGNRHIKTEELKGKLNLHKGQALSPQVVNKAKKNIVSFYKDKGYLLAKVEPETFKSEKKGEVILNFQIEEGKKVHVEKINFHGNKTFGDGELKDQMETKEAHWWRSGDFKQEVFKEDLKKVIDFYKERGFEDAKIVKQTRRYNDSKTGLIIDITLKEGPLYKFGKISWEGNEVFSDKEISKQIKISEGDVYNPKKLKEVLGKISALYQERGYLNARVLPDVKPVGNKLNVNFKISEGGISRISKIIIEGNTKTKEKVIRRELKIKPGQVFRRSDLKESIRKLYQLNFFKEVKPEIKSGKNGEVNLIIKVKEKSTGRAYVGLGYSKRDKLTGSVGINIPNLFGNGQSIDLNLEITQRNETFNFSFTEPWLFDTPTSGKFNLYRISEQWDDFDEKRQGGYLRIGRRLTWLDEYSRIYLKYNLEQVEYTNFNKTYKEGYEESGWGPSPKKDWPQVSSSVSLTYLRDTRDMPQFPSQGSLFSYKLVGGALSGGEEYHKHLVDYSFYCPLFWKFVFVAKTDLGFVASLSPDEAVPFKERFMPGGTSLDGVIRGYPDKSVGPYKGGSPIGGKSMLVSNIELRFPIAKRQIWGLFFFDAGNAWKEVSGITSFDLKHSVGFGVRLTVPMMGMIGFDLGYSQEGKWRTHFRFGPNLVETQRR